MMTLSDFKTILASTEYPVAYLAFPASDAPEMPFIVYEDTGSDNFGADNKVWVSGRRIQVDLFCKHKSLTSESLLESTFDSNDIYWDRVTEWDDNEAFYRTTYEVVI